MGAIDPITYLDCPACGDPCPDPFIRGQVHRYLHRRGSGHSSCKFVVRVAPAGDNHEFWVLDEGQDYEDVLPQVLSSPEQMRAQMQSAYLRAHSVVEELEDEVRAARADE